MARIIDGNALYQEFEAMLWHDNADRDLAEDMLLRMPTLTPPNEWVNQIKELDELYIRLWIITGFTAEQLIEMFAAGYTLEKADHSKDFEEIANLAEVTPPNEPLRCAGCYYLDEQCAPCVYCIRGAGYADYFRRPPEGEGGDAGRG